MMETIAHRGASALEPENTLRSFRRAAAEGADAIELDLRLTRDEQLIVLHDATVDRTTDGSGEVARMTLAELRELDAGHGERIPAFEEVLEVVDLPIYAEMKVIGAARPLAALIHARHLEQRVVPISFRSEALVEINRVLPKLPAGLILSDAPPNAVEQARSAGANLVSLEHTGFGSETLENCRSAGLNVTVWTVNETAEMERIRMLDVNGIVTDRPDLLADTLRRTR